jgi:hypothetical protein
MRGLRGFWNTISEETGKAQSVVAIYEYQGGYYGRLIGSYDDAGKINDTIYDPKKRAYSTARTAILHGDGFHLGLTSKGF